MAKNCNNCKFTYKECEEEPCIRCKNNILTDSTDYYKAPFLWEPGENVDAIDLMREGYHETFINDAIKPEYYNDTKIAPIDVIEDWDLDFCLGSALKYIKRAGKKDNNPSVQDLQKVIWYVERRIKELEEASE